MAKPYDGQVRDSRPRFTCGGAAVQVGLEGLEVRYRCSKCKGLDWTVPVDEDEGYVKVRGTWKRVEEVKTGK